MTSCIFNCCSTVVFMSRNIDLVTLWIEKFQERFFNPLLKSIKHLKFVIFSIITVNKIAIIKVKRIVFAHPWIFWNYIVLVNSPIFTHQYQWYYDIIKISEILLSLTSIQTPKPALKLTKPPVCWVIFESSFTLLTFEIKRLWSILKCLKAPEAV